MAANVTLQQPSSFQELQDDIARFRYQVVQHGLKKWEKIDFELAVNEVARAIVETPLKKEERDALFTELLKLRDLTIRHIPVKGLKGTCLFLNTIQNVPPSPICLAYNKMAFPTVSNYGQIGNNFVCIRLDPKALDCVPETVKNACPLEGKDVEILYTVIHGDFYQDQNRTLNNNVHPWAHVHALPGDDTFFDVNMGIFPEFGLQKSDLPGAIAFNQLSPMNVHVHVWDKANKAKEKATAFDMDYSPNNAHFNLVPGSPFSVDWSVMQPLKQPHEQKDDRVAITKRVILFDENHPICQAIIHSIHGCRNLNDHVERLPRISDAIDETFEPVINAFATNDPNAMDMFHQLPLAFRHGIYEQTWILFDRPPHLDFGRASFEKDGSLDAKYHCTPGQWTDAVANFSNWLKTLLVHSQIDLLHSQSLVKGDNVLTMMKCAQLFYKNSTKAFAAFDQLPEQEKEAIRYAFWELNGCKRIHNYSTKYFPVDATTPAERKQKIQSVLLAASRQPHRFERPLVENLVNELYELPPELLTPELLAEFQQQPQPLNAPLNPDNNDMGFSNPYQLFDQLFRFNPLTNQLEIVNNNVVDSNVRVEEVVEEEEELPASSAYSTTTASTSSTSSTSPITTTTTTTQTIQERVNAQLFDLIYTQEFLVLGIEERTNRVNQVLSQLPKDLSDNIYGSVWFHSIDAGKNDGDPSWGQKHVADDLTALANALQQVLGATV